MNELNVLKRICRHLFLAVLLCAVSAATASAQVPTVTVDAKNVTIKELLQRIEANSQYTFAYIDADINPDKRVSVKAVNRSIASIIAEVLPNVNMEVKGLKIVLTAKRGGESQTRPAADAGRTVKGRVTDESGAPVIGATVILKGTTIGTATNAMGEYAIDIRLADAVLVYSLIGYNKVELALADNQTQADVTLKSEAIAMDNVVVVGYGVQNKRDVTTAISSIKAEDFAAMPTADFRDAMAAKMPGVQVLTLGGQPDGNVSIRIRGIQSATSGNDPLYVIDGVPCDARAFSNLESSDIESLEVLKDASAAAIYGSRGSCGVILITTKRGSAGKVSVSYNGYFGIQQPIYLPDFVDGATYMEYINEANRNTTGVDKYTPEQIRITREGSDPIHYPSTDWMKETMRETAPIHEHNFTVSGGNTTARFALSAQYLNQDGMYKVMDNGFERLTVRANTTVNLNKDIMMFVDMFVGRDTQRQPETMNKTILDYIYLAPPTLVSKYPRKEGQKPGYDYYGVYFEWMNPLANLERGTQVESVRDYVTINARPTWHIIPGLTLKGQVGYRIASGMDKKDRNAYVFLDYFSGNESGTFGAVKSATYTTRTSYWMVGATLDWTKEFGNHRINILGGWNEEVDRRNGWDDVALLSFFGKAYYSYKDKYLAEVGIRRDGSSLFGDGHKWGNFPSVAVGWNVNREPWMQNARFIDNFKIRASYGMLGNNNVALYRYQTIIDNSGNEIVNGNPDLTWEKVKILDAGVDLSLFGQKLEVTFDWFRKVTDDMIVNVPSTPSSGLLAAPMNVGKAEVKGYEIGVGFNHSFTKDIDFSINLGYSYNKSKWLEITNDELINGNTIYRKGHAIKEYYGYQADHLLTQDDLDFRVPIIGGYDGATTAQLPGDIRYVDTNGDKVITTDDRVPLGDQDPHSVYYGNLSFRWKNLDFDMQVNGVGYVPIFYQGLISNPLDPEYGGTPQRWHLDHWKAENPDRNAKLPRVTTDPGNNALLSTFWKENGAFVRIKYMQLGYNFKALAKKIHAGNFRVYVNVQNPFTFTKVELIDPETKGTHTTYPMFKTYSVGLNVNF